MHYKILYLLLLKKEEKKSPPFFAAIFFVLSTTAFYCSALDNLGKNLSVRKRSAERIKNHMHTVKTSFVSDLCHVAVKNIFSYHWEEQSWKVCPFKYDFLFPWIMHKQYSETSREKEHAITIWNWTVFS